MRKCGGGIDMGLARHLAIRAVQSGLPPQAGQRDKESMNLLQSFANGLQQNLMSYQLAHLITPLVLS
jgi:hypothetical protein